MDDIEGRLFRLAALRREREIVDARAADLRQRIGVGETELAELRRMHAVEQRDVDRLEGLSLSRVVVALRGSRAETLDRERAEANMARYRVAEAEARLATLERELAVVDTRRGELATVPAQYATAIDDKERHILATGRPGARELMALAEERGRTEAELRELDEAARAADTAVQALAEVGRHLDSAGSWSAYDTFFGGGAIVSSFKHDRLDSAARAAAYADRCLAMLRTELADVGLAAPLGNVSVDGLTRFVDVWFDNIFTDMAVRDRIKRAQSNVEHAQRMVAGIRRNVRTRQVSAGTRWDELARARHDLLVR